MAMTVAFLRGINVGGHRVRMDRLREIFEEMGFADVSTFIASGNVLFTPDRTEMEVDLVNRIEHHLREALGYDVDVLLRTPDELEAIAATAATLPSHAALYVIFLAAPLPEAGKAALRALRSAVDDFHFGEREVFWILQCKVSESPLFRSGIETVMAGATRTSRNVNTVHRLLAKVRG